MKSEKVTKVGNTTVTQTIHSGNSDDANAYFAKRIEENRILRVKKRNATILRWTLIIISTILIIVLVNVFKKAKYVGNGGAVLEQKHVTHTEDNNNCWYYINYY